MTWSRLTSDRLPSRSSLARWRQPGIRATGTGLALIVALWLAAPPAGATAGLVIGQLLGVAAIWLLAASVLSITDRHRLGLRFGDIGEQLWWHRLAGSVGMVVAVVHPRITEIGLTESGERSASLAVISLLQFAAIGLVLWALLGPGTRAVRWRGPLGWLARRGYDSWRYAHGLLAVYLLAAMWHGLNDARGLTSSIPWLAAYLTVCAFGVFAVVDRHERIALLWSGRDGEGETALATELQRFADEHPWFSVRVIDTRDEPRLNAAAILAAGGVSSHDVGVRLSGPRAMTSALRMEVLAAGVTQDHLEIESTSFR